MRHASVTVLIAAVAAGLAVSYVAANPEKAQAASILRFILKADKDAQRQCERMEKFMHNGLPLPPVRYRQCELWIGTCIRRPRGGRGPRGLRHAYCTLHAAADDAYIGQVTCDRYQHYVESRAGFIRATWRFSDPRWYCSDDPA